MSQVFPLIDGFVGYGDGLEAQLQTDVAWDVEHPLVVARPELFTEPPAPPVDVATADEPPAPAEPTPPAEPQPAPTAPPAKGTRRKSAPGGAS